ncbi:MAG: family 78 glycoside hydrolase catalytic domain [Anaerolineaceae bacterium]|nr:family 78 glycoside hydrolase catalytic domain [Anaerolineaceae bacterium]
MRKFERRAEWVWRQRGLGEVPFNTARPLIAAESNRYVYFRRTFDIVETVTSASAAVSADGRYQLYVNGQLVGRGPARCSPAWQYVDEYDLTPYLRPGRNVIAALAHSYGLHTAWYELPDWEQARAFGCGGFFLQGDVTNDSGHSIHLDTGQGWRYRESDSWERNVPSGSLGFIEIYDARHAPQSWHTVDFNDSDWDEPEILRIPGRNYAGDVIPFPVLIPSDIPRLAESPRWAEAVVRVAEVQNAPPAIDIASLFAHETLADLHHCRVDGAENLATDSGVTVITTTDTHSVSLILDFGLTQPGRVRFDLDGPAGTIVDFTYSERLHDDGRVHMHQGIPGFDVYAAHRVILREGRQTWEAFELSGFRYLQMTVRHCESPLTVHAIRLNFTAYPVEHTGQFTCSDDLLNRIWQAGVTTLHHCMLDGYVDCPSREQRQWLDAYLDSLINYVAFGDPYLAAKMLRQVAQSQQPDGLTMMVAPGDFSVLHFTNIPDFCLYWILAIGAYLDYTGDLDIVNELYTAVVKAIGWFERHLNEDDLLTDVPHWVFVDWAELDKKGQVTALNAHFVAALGVALRMAELAESAQDARLFAHLREVMTAAINRHVWDDERGVYVDARRDGVQSRRISQQSNAAVMAFGIAPTERWSRILATILDDEQLVLTRFGAAQAERVDFDDEQHVVLAQPFYMHFLHRALCQAGQHAVMLENIRRRWGALVAAGDRTFRESWQIIPLTSLCHAWAGTPTFDLSAEILGVRPLTPGFARVLVAPHPVDLAWAKGTVPTPHGAVEVAWWVEADSFKLTVTIPAGSEGLVILPKIKPSPWKSVTVNGSPVSTSDSLMLEAGTYHITASYINEKI